MKEKWIKKLIELFKYYVDNYWTDTKNTEKEYWIIDYWQWFQYWTKEYLYETIISKKFLFIDWLVKEDKIDFVKLDDNSDWYEINTGREYLDLVALLSIQDNPVEFLISILK